MIKRVYQLTCDIGLACRDTEALLAGSRDAVITAALSVGFERTGRKNGEEWACRYCAPHVKTHPVVGT